MAAITNNYNNIKTIIKDTLVNHINSVIASGFDDPEARLALAQAMSEPIARALEYQAIGRRLLMVDDPLQPGVLAGYERGVSSTANYLYTRGPVPNVVVELNFPVPIHEISHTTRISLNDIIARRFSISSEAEDTEGTQVQEIVRRLLRALGKKLEDLDIQSQLAMTANDPNLILTT